MSDYQLQGEIILMADKQTFDGGFEKREFVVDTGGKYPQQIKLELIKDKCALLDGLSVGQSVAVSFNVRGNEYNGRHYVNLQAWKIDALGQAPAGEPYQGPSAEQGAPADDRMPF